MTLTATQSAELRQALDRVRKDKADNADALKAARTAYGQLQHRLTEGKADSSEAFAAKKEVDTLEAKQRELRDEEATYLGLIGQGAPNGDGGSALSRLDDPDFRRHLSSLAFSSAHFEETVAQYSPEEVAGWTGRSIQAASVAPPTPGMLQGPFQRVVPFPTAPTSFLDLVPTMVMEYPSFPYAQETLPTTQPAVTAPGAAKTAVDFLYNDAEASPETIAGYIKQNRQTLADVGMLGGLIQTRLMTRLLHVLETQVLSGTGSVSDRTGKSGIVGLLNTTGVAAIAPTAGDVSPDHILDAIVSVLVAGAQPNVVALNPSDWATQLKGKATGSGEYFSSPFLQTVSNVWGVTMVPCVGVPAKKVIIGDTNLGMTLLVREGASVRVSDADQDDMTRNRVTILAEGRWALAVWVPAAFCVVTFS
jgi:hypothetical protein